MDVESLSLVADLISSGGITALMVWLYVRERTTTDRIQSERIEDWRRWTDALSMLIASRPPAPQDGKPPHHRDE